VAAHRTYDALMLRPSSQRWLVLGAVLGFLVATAAAVFAALTAASASDDSGVRRSQQAAADLSERALAAGRQIAVDFAAYDYRHIAEDFKRVADESTGKFHQDYLTQSTGAHDLIVKARSVSTAEVASAGLVNSSERQATVVVALNRTIDNRSLQQPQNDSFGLEITLLFQQGHWLASEVNPL
jgi:Mce-associated membrane protein